MLVKAWLYGSAALRCGWTSFLVDLVVETLGRGEHYRCNATDVTVQNRDHNMWEEPQCGGCSVATSLQNETQCTFVPKYRKHEPILCPCVCRYWWWQEREDSLLLCILE